MSSFGNPVVKSLTIRRAGARFVGTQKLTGNWNVKSHLFASQRTASSAASVPPAR
jgi:hypothetical protein